MSISILQKKYNLSGINFFLSFKGRIENETWSGLRKYYDIVEQEVQLEKDINLAVSGGITSQHNRHNDQHTKKTHRKHGGKREKSEAARSYGDASRHHPVPEIAGRTANSEVIKHGKNYIYKLLLEKD